MSPLSGTVIYKMTGSGNDFVLADGRADPVDVWPPGRIRRLCARRTGVGADGLVVLEPGAGAAAVRFHFYNADGGRAAMCGNASLCATRLAAWLRMAPADGMTLETDAGAFRTRCVDPGERAEILLPDVERLSHPQEIELRPGEVDVALAAVGVPHLVVLVEDVAAVDVMVRGRELRSARAIGPAGANVNFVSGGSAGWRMRTYERGVEAETLACGTGAVSCAAALVGWRLAALPWEVTSSAGPRLTISGEPGADGVALARPRLVGEARLVFRAVLGEEPEELPDPS